MTSPSPPARHSTGTGKLLVEVAGAVAVVTINNPGKRLSLIHISEPTRPY